MTPLSGTAPRGTALALLHEVRHALDRLTADGTPSTFDLRALPLMSDDLLLMDRFLGAGEVTASVDAGGRSAVRETRFAGVWLVDHFDGEEPRPAARLIEVDFVPSLLRTQSEDAADGLRDLDEALAELSPETSRGGGITAQSEP